MEDWIIHPPKAKKVARPQRTRKRKGRGRSSEQTRHTSSRSFQSTQPKVVPLFYNGWTSSPAPLVPNTSSPTSETVPRRSLSPHYQIRASQPEPKFSFKTTSRGARKWRERTSSHEISQTASYSTIHGTHVPSRGRT